MKFCPLNVLHPISDLLTESAEHLNAKSGKYEEEQEKEKTQVAHLRRRAPEGFGINNHSPGAAPASRCPGVHGFLWPF